MEYAILNNLKRIVGKIRPHNVKRKILKKVGK